MLRSGFVRGGLVHTGKHEGVFSCVPVTRAMCGGTLLFVRCDYVMLLSVLVAIAGNFFLPYGIASPQLNSSDPASRRKNNPSDAHVFTFLCAERATRAAFEPPGDSAFVVLYHRPHNIAPSLLCYVPRIALHPYPPRCTCFPAGF